MDYLTKNTLKVNHSGGRQWLLKVFSCCWIWFHSMMEIRLGAISFLRFQKSRKKNITCFTLIPGGTKVICHMSYLEEKLAL